MIISGRRYRRERVRSGLRDRPCSALGRNAPRLTVWWSAPLRQCSEWSVPFFGTHRNRFLVLLRMRIATADEPHQFLRMQLIAGKAVRVLLGHWALMPTTGAHASIW